MPAVQLLHTMLRVVDEEKALAFYSSLGFQERGRKRVGRDTATIIFLSLPGDDNELELTLNDGRTEPYDQGDAYGHIALAIEDLDGELARLAELGIEPEKPPYSAYPGGSRICFVRDPDDYRVELIERKP